MTKKGHQAPSTRRESAISEESDAQARGGDEFTPPPLKLGRLVNDYEFSLVKHSTFRLYFPRLCKLTDYFGDEVDPSYITRQQALDYLAYCKKRHSVRWVQQTRQIASNLWQWMLWQGYVSYNPWKRPKHYPDIRDIPEEYRYTSRR